MTKMPEYSTGRIYPVCDIPNKVGFTLHLVKGTAQIPAVVAQDANGLHICKDLHGSYRLCTAFDGWTVR